MADISKRGGCDDKCDDGEGGERGGRGKRGRRGPRGRDGCDGKDGRDGNDCCECGAGAAQLDPNGPSVTLAGCDEVKSPYFIRVCKHHGKHHGGHGEHGGHDHGNCHRSQCQPNTKDDGINIYVQDVGECVLGTIVLIAAVVEDLWMYQVQNLAARGFRVIVVVPRGTGHSDQPYGPHSYDIWADDLRQVLDCLDVSDITLVGSSGGSAMALHYVARHQGWRVGRLVLASTAPLDPTNATPDPVLDAFLFLLTQDYPAASAGFLATVFAPFVPSPQSFQFFLDSAFLTKNYSFMQYIEYTGRTAPQQNFLLNDLPAINVPTLILHGTQDLITPFPIALQLQAGIAGSTLVPFVGSGHWPQIDSKNVFNDQLAMFAETGSCPTCECPHVPKKKMIDWKMEGPVFEDSL